MSSSIYANRSRKIRPSTVAVAFALFLSLAQTAGAESPATSQPAAKRPGADKDRPGIYPAVNLSVTLGATWGDSDYATPLQGQFAFSLRAELALSRYPGGWGLGLYGEMADPGSHFESRWLGGGGLHLLSPRLWIFGAALSSGFYGREAHDGAYPGFTSGLSLGIRPRVVFWDFLLAFRVDLRRALDRDEQSVTIGAHVDVAVLLAIIGAGLKHGSFASF